MRIEEDFVLDAPPEEAFAFLGDVERVARCVPGVGELQHRDDGTHEAQLRVEVGPVRTAFAGQVEVTPQPPDRLTARGRGRDRTTGSRAEVTFDAHLSPGDEANSTRVESVADVTIRGRLGQFGTGVIRATATELIREFVACANASLTGSTGAEPTRAPAASGRLLWRVLVSVVRRWWRRLTRRDRSSESVGR